MLMNPMFPKQISFVKAVWSVLKFYGIYITCFVVPLSFFRFLGLFEGFWTVNFNGC